MSWRQAAKPYSENEVEKDWRQVAQSYEETSPSQLKRERTFGERLPAKAGAEFFGGAIGAIPGLARAQAEHEPLVQLQEELARPEYLPSSGLEAAPEKSIRTLLALIGKIPGIEKFTPESLRERFKETTGGQFEPKTSTEKIIGHGAGALGQGLLFGPEAAAGVGFGGLIGESARELGIPNKIASFLEILASGKPTLKKGLLPKRSQEALVNYAKKKGLTDAEISPLLHGEFSQDILTKLAYKGPKTKKLLKGAEEKIGSALESVEKEAAQFPRISKKQATKLKDDFHDIAYRLEKNVAPSPEEIKAADYIKGAVDKLEAVGADPEELINFWRSMNRGVNWKDVSKGKKILFQMKKPIQDLLHEINPKFANDFKLSNELYSKFKKVESNLKPDMMDKFKTLGTAGTLLTGIATLNPIMIKGAIGSAAGQVLAREMLINPKLQNLHRKAIENINSGNLRMANSILQNFQSEMEKKYPKVFKNVNIGTLPENFAKS
jgi:hypothetical protein